MAPNRPTPPPAARCPVAREIGAQRFPCHLEAGHEGIHMSPGDSGQETFGALVSTGPFLVTWPNLLPGKRPA